MLNIIHGHDQIIRLDRKVKVTDPVTVIQEGMAVKLDGNEEVVLSGADASVEDFIWWAFNSANVADEINSAFKLIGNITLVNGIFIAETDQFLETGSYAYGTKLATENGLLFDGALGDFCIARALGAPVNGFLKFITLPLAGKI